jgi:hypothetical protein
MSGMLAQAGWSPATSWTQAHQAATQRLRMVSESITEVYDKLRSQALVGQVAQHEFINGIVNVTGEIVCELSFDANDTTPFDDGILEYCMGANSSRTYDLANTSDKWFHLTIDKVTRRYYFASCKVNSFSLSGEADSEAPIKLSLNITARVVTDDATVFPSLAVAGSPVFFKHMILSSASYFMINAFGADGALDATDACNIKSFELAVDNALKSDSKDSGSAVYVVDPARDGFRTVTLKVSVARYLATAPISSFRTWKAAGTQLQAIIGFSDGSSTYICYLPQMKITEGADFNVGGPGIIEGEVSFEAFRNLNNTTHMSAVTDQLRIVAA